MKIALIELDYHAEVLRDTLLLLFALDIEIELVTTERIWKQVSLDGETPNMTLHLVDEKQHVPRQLDDLFSRINGCDLIHFNTLASNFKYFAARSYRPPSLLRLHNLNTYLSKGNISYHMKLTPYQLWKDASYAVRKVILENELVERPRFLAHVDAFVVHNESMQECAHQRYGVAKSMCHVVPMGYARKMEDGRRKKEDYTVAVVGGTIDPRRRDYDDLLNAIASVSPNLTSKFELVLLGSSSTSYGRDVVRQLRASESEHFTITSYDGFVPQAEFERQLMRANFLIHPIQQTSRYTLYDEQFGRTKIPGSMVEMIRYQLPGLVPEFYEVEPSLSTWLEKYDGPGQLAKLILKHVHDRKSFGDPAQLSGYSKKRVAEKLHSALLATVERR